MAPDADLTYNTTVVRTANVELRSSISVRNSWTHPILSTELSMVTTGMTEPMVKTESLPDTEVWRQMAVTLHISHPVPQMIRWNRLAIEQYDATVFANIRWSAR